ncbi:hypothetical protein ANANG_G00165030 [Anguilla anguilla]|uniref:Uncharacterized protein n=1 Tax=Anguilla anguilla TaxID=7936 RepID=A0A9D3RV49_ANGAN|nr:hypothetical protein ANANG_G00165030 [Anguilla anguilla]
MSSEELWSGGGGGGVVARIGPEHGEDQDGVMLGRISSLPLALSSANDFRGKFKKIHSKRRPSILDGRSGKSSLPPCFLDKTPFSSLTSLAYVPLSSGTLSKAEIQSCFTGCCRG